MENRRMPIGDDVDLWELDLWLTSRIGPKKIWPEDEDGMTWWLDLSKEKIEVLFFKDLTDDFYIQFKLKFGG